MNFQKSYYWNDIADTWQHSDRQKLLRTISDKLNSRLFDIWLPQEKVNLLLKTDLFDESLTDGLYPLLAKRANQVVGIDISDAVVNAAKNRYEQLQAVRADVRSLPFAAETFDVVISNSTLDHFATAEEIECSLKELNRVLRKGGQLLITLDNYANPLIFLRSILPFDLLHRMGILPYYVGVTFGARRLRSTLESLNFSVVEMTSIWHLPRIIVAPVANLVEKYFSDKSRNKFINTVLAFECFAKLPIRNFTGQFVAARAVKRS